MTEALDAAAVAMSRPRCTICAHPNRARLELAMARGMGKREASKRFEVSADALWRHWSNHVSDAVKAARKAEVLKPGARLAQLVEETDAGLLERLHIIEAVLMVQLDAANEINDGRTVAALAGRLIDLQQVVAKATGEIRPHAGSVTNNLIVSPDYLALRFRLVEALRPFPEAAMAVAEVFRSTEAVSMARLAPPAVAEASE